MTWTVAVALRGGRGSQQVVRRSGPEPDAGWRSLSGAAEDRNFWEVRGWGRHGTSGGRPPGRPRIATASATPPAPRAARVAVALRGGRGSQPRRSRTSPAQVSMVAVALRGGRGSQRGAVEGAAEEGVWRSPSGAAEDRNADSGRSFGHPRVWRSPSGAAEDRNSNLARVRSCSADRLQGDQLVGDLMHTHGS